MTDAKLLIFAVLAAAVIVGAGIGYYVLVYSADDAAAEEESEELGSAFSDIVDEVKDILTKPGNEKLLSVLKDFYVMFIAPIVVMIHSWVGSQWTAEGVF